MKRAESRFEKVLVAVIILLLFTPLIASLRHVPAGLSALVQGKTPLPTNRNGLFTKNNTKVRQPWPGWEKFKAAFAERVNTDFFGRDLMIRWTSETWFRVFHMCAAKSADVTVGKGDSLFLNGYFREYCQMRGTQKDIEPLVADLKRMQDVCENLHIAFVLLVTPSKAAICTEDIPPEWMRLYDPRPRAYDYFIPLLKEQGIRFVDGHALALQSKANAPAPLFPKGGIHWGQYAASLATNAVIAELKAQGKPVAPIDFRVRLDNTPGVEESDIIRLMKLEIPWSFPIAQMEIQPRPLQSEKPPNVVVIGGSFMWRMIQQMVASRQFSEIDGYFYYKLFKSCNWTFEKGQNTIVRDPTGEMDFAREVYGADCLVLEINESQISNAAHLKTFIQDALTHVPEKGSTDSFHYESYQPYQWGEPLSFRACDFSKWKKFSLEGFCPFEADATWTAAPVASVRLAVPPASRDLQLKAQLSAFVIPGKIPHQDVKIFANGNQAGEWQFADDQSTSREITIRNEWLRNDGKLILEFKMDHPGNRTRLKMGRNAPVLGLNFATIHINESDQ